MCIVCTEYTKGLLTFNEALANLQETVINNEPTEHYFEALELLFQDEEDEEN